MAYPEGVTTCDVLIGDALNFHGENMRVRVFITPVLGGESTHLVHSASGAALAPVQRTWVAEANGGLVSIPLPHVDQAGFIDESGAAATMWAYRAHVRLESPDGAVEYEKNFQLVAGQSIVDLDKIPDGPISEPLSAPVPAVTSVNGQTGAVTVPDTIVVLTQAEYDALPEHDPTIMYAITGA